MNPFFGFLEVAFVEFFFDVIFQCFDIMIGSFFNLFDAVGIRERLLVRLQIQLPFNDESQPAASGAKAKNG